MHKAQLPVRQGSRGIEIKTVAVLLRLILALSYLSIKSEK